MTPGQARALRELSRVHAADPDRLDVLGDPKEVSGQVTVTISLWMGLLETRPGGLQFRERERFRLIIPAEFPFDYPGVAVDHQRFAGFPHVCWMTTLCLYQSKAEWNPADGMYGFLERLVLWLTRAARNEMDPLEGPLEPPHFLTDASQPPFVIRSDAPTQAGERWIGWALLDKRPNRTELLGWREFADDVPPEQGAALAIMLSEPLPMEFPLRGEDLFRELVKCGLDGNFLLRLLGLAATVTADDQPAYLVMGLPMRRAADGSQRLHIAVWTTSPHYARSLRLAEPRVTDSQELLSARQELADVIYEVFKDTRIEWCRVLEDRDEIVVRRDSRTPMAWFRGKRVLILGGGALGSWAAEMIARGRPHTLHVVDNAIVKPGLLTRQNFTVEDIGADKASALAGRLRSIAQGTEVQGFKREAHRFVLADLDRLAAYDLVLDCTASSILHMKLQRDWHLVRSQIQRFISFMIDARAESLLGISLAAESEDGPWSAYVRLKHTLCTDNYRSDIIRTFYSPRAVADLFQPEPGCSDPTFSGSTADVSRLAATALSCLIGNFPDRGATKAVACRMPLADGTSGRLDVTTLPAILAATAGEYRILVSQKVLSQARAFVRQNTRLRSRVHETGGLLWGFWDDAARVIVLLDASGPPPDSRHDPGHFVCGVEGTAAEHEYRITHSHGVSGFIGLWHTHPDMPATQSGEDVHGMTDLVAGALQNRRRAVMLIFGRDAGRGSAGAYVYEADQVRGPVEFLRIGSARLVLADPVV